MLIRLLKLITKRYSSKSRYNIELLIVLLIIKATSRSNSSNLIRIELITIKSLIFIY